MKIVHFSDLHLAAPGVMVGGSDPHARLAQVVADINRHYADADRVVITGDLSDTGAPGTYAALRDALAPLIPPVMLTLGNHDARDPFAAAFPEHMTDGFAQSVADIGECRVVLADTLEPGQLGGRLCRARLAWLDRALQTERDILLFLHHPPLDFGMADLDPIRLADEESLAALLEGRPVRHIGGGHVHRIVAGGWQGIPYAFLRSINHQTPLVPGPGGPEAACYAVLSTSGGSTVCHFREFVTA